ncbi:MAG: YbjN domain-containing protein [Zavarzinella sp.]
MSIFSDLLDYMEQEKWVYEIVEGKELLRFHFKSGKARVTCFAEADEAKQWLIFYTLSPVVTPTDQLDRMAEFITRANYGLRMGNFELDFSDGEVRFKSSIDIEGGELTHKMIDNLLRSNLTAMNRYFDGMMRTIYTEAAVEEIIRDVEAKRGSSANVEPDRLTDQTDDDDDLDED